FGLRLGNRLLEPLVADLGQRCGRVLKFRMLDGARKGLSRRGSARLAEEGLENQVNHVAHRHEAREAAQEPSGLQRIMEQLVKEYSAETRAALAVDHLARQAGPIDLGALEKLEPVSGLVHQLAADIFLP